MKSYTVSQAAQLARVTVRTLHYWDEIGLLEPSGRTESNYRLYSHADLERLQQILLFRELGFSIEAIRVRIDDPQFDRRGALVQQRKAMLEKKQKTDAIIRAIDAALAALDGETEMSTEEMFRGFEDEARERWGDTEQFEESMRRTKRYGPKEWAAIKAEAAEFVQKMVELMNAGKRPDDGEVVDAAETHRLHIDRWFYPCDQTMHAHLADLYVADPRFADYYDRNAPGLASFVSEAIKANTRKSRV